MKLRVTGITITALALLTVTSGACGGAKDNGLFSGGGDGGTTSDAKAADTGGGTGGDDQATDGSVPQPGPDGDVVDAAPLPPVDASTGVDVTPCPAADPNVGVAVVTVDKTTYALGNSSWTQSGQNGADSMSATWGSQCDGQVDLTTYNHAGTFDVDTRMQNAGVVDGPRITFRPQGAEYVAGFDFQNACNPCGSGSITVSSWANGNVSGTFDVIAKKLGSGQTRAFTGTFSFHK